jgi:hypothetical protein
LSLKSRPTLSRPSLFTALGGRHTKG